MNNKQLEKLAALIFAILLFIGIIFCCERGEKALKEKIVKRNNLMKEDIGLGYTLDNKKDNNNESSKDNL